MQIENDYEKEVYNGDVGYIDFPEPGIKLYCTDGVIMLPGEY